MASRSVEDAGLARDLIFSFLWTESSSRRFSRHIGDAKKFLDARAASEQAKFWRNLKDPRELKALGEEYRAKFGVKFLISAKGKSASEILAD